MGMKVRLLVAAAAVATGVLTGATGAQASLGSCSGAVQSLNSWTVYCNGTNSTHEYRATAKCYTLTGVYHHTAYGSWVTAGWPTVNSTASCTSQYELADGYWQTRLK
ncbi:hypothetical protein ACFQY4_13895 [Catellatospora bangladeshensis]|uniref:Uncharacterized protein n=1 Tax=Catellatospora bangladeshensis TaxID=310355 RepID=A0A8J3JQ78_9ACTN|nr:hypothetical protein [Catellatospora bangladeshensis]GIF84907.1 hypothetical protein Cba03nite_62560 [Catellatospora bangladeshensis]